MLRFLESLREKHGSIEQCVIDHELLDGEGISRLKENMIVDATTNHSIARKSIYTLELVSYFMTVNFTNIYLFV